MLEEALYHVPLFMLLQISSSFTESGGSYLDWHGLDSCDLPERDPESVNLTSIVNSKVSIPAVSLKDSHYITDLAVEKWYQFVLEATLSWSRIRVKILNAKFIRI